MLARSCVLYVHNLVMTGCVLEAPAPGSTNFVIAWLQQYKLPREVAFHSFAVFLLDRFLSVSVVGNVSQNILCIFSQRGHTDSNRTHVPFFLFSRFSGQMRPCSEFTMTCSNVLTEIYLL